MAKQKHLTENVVSPYAVASIQLVVGNYHITTIYTKFEIGAKRKRKFRRNVVGMEMRKLLKEKPCIPWLFFSGQRLKTPSVCCEVLPVNATGTVRFVRPNHIQESPLLLRDPRNTSRNGKGEGGGTHSVRPISDSQNGLLKKGEGKGGEKTTWERRVTYFVTPFPEAWVEVCLSSPPLPSFTHITATASHERQSPSLR